MVAFRGLVFRVGFDDGRLFSGVTSGASGTEPCPAKRRAILAAENDAARAARSANSSNSWRATQCHSPVPSVPPQALLDNGARYIAAYRVASDLDKFVALRECPDEERSAAGNGISESSINNPARLVKTL